MMRQVQKEGIQQLPDASNGRELTPIQTTSMLTLDTMTCRQNRCSFQAGETQHSVDRQDQHQGIDLAAVMVFDVSEIERNGEQQEDQSIENGDRFILAKRAAEANHGQQGK